jgi:hypothetical protein
VKKCNGFRSLTIIKTRCRWYLITLCFCALTCSSALAQRTWRTELVDGGKGFDVGKWAALVIDKDGNFHIGYWAAVMHESRERRRPGPDGIMPSDNSPSGLRYAYRGATEKKWSTMQVDNGHRGTFLSAAVDGNNMPHFAYTSVEESGLFYAHLDGNKWDKKLLDPAKIDYFTSISLDAAGHPRISYFWHHSPDGSYALHLKYAAFDGQRWTIQTLDPRIAVGKWSSVTVDMAGNSHIAYSYQAKGDLLYAHWDGSKWDFAAPDLRHLSNDYLGFGPSIAVDSSGNPRIAYFDGTGALVKYAYFNGTSWQREVVEKIAGMGELDRVSLKLDSNNRPHLAYSDAGAGVLKYAVKNGTSWVTEVVDNQGELPSLALNDRGLPYIAYYKQSENSLCIAHPEEPAPTSAQKAKQVTPAASRLPN